MEQVIKVENFIFHNPHSVWLKNNLKSFLYNKKSIEKYDYLFDEIYKRSGNNKIKVLINGASYSHLFDGIFRILNIPIIEFYAWAYLNKLDLRKFQIIRNCKNLKNTDIIFSFLYEHFTNKTGKFSVSREKFIKDFKLTNAYKVVHLSHYGYNINLSSRLCSEAKVNLFVAESNLFKNSQFFKKHFHWYNKNVYVLPFVPSERFKKITPFSERNNLAIATGTITHPMTDLEFINFYHNDVLQPMRNKIYDNRIFIKSQIDSKISLIDLPEKLNNKKLKNIKVVKILLLTLLDLVNLMKLVFRKNSFDKNKTKHKETNYYKFDIVKEYNNYKMFIVPEEVIDLPAIGFVEGMACGSAFIGINNNMYKDIGLVDKVNYIAYDGSLDDLIGKIKYYQENPIELEFIANNGYEFVKHNFNKENVCNNFIKYINNSIKIND